MKLMKWLLKISLTAVLVSTLSILTTGIVVNAYLQSVLASFNIQLEGQPLGAAGIMKSFFGMNTSGEGKTRQEPQESGRKGSEGDGTDPKEVNREVDGDTPPDNSLPVMGNSINESAVEQQIVMTPDEMVDKKSSLTTQEKEEIFTLLMTKLPQEIMQKISVSMEDGLTAVELDEIEKGISQYLSKEEFEKLMTMLQK
ncbi:hypothetical protein [Paenibacillus dakarensis]|uniref:hypothetical protein n=1 Tax=Paenibacillus dakarensis TaxID=1527293 RepID=UPI0006D57423|nr:hypothetical protein [Paenibacillus dakarensis]